MREGARDAFDWERRARYWHAIATRAIPAIRSRSVDDVPGTKTNPSGPQWSPEEIKRALRSYRITHWGKGGSDAPHVVRCADPTGVLTHLGELRSVVYETDKAGDPPGTRYEHKFKSPLPELTYSQGGLLAICGGAYRVTWRGIVG